MVVALRPIKKSDVYGEVVKSPNFKPGQKVTMDDMISAVDRLYDKRFPVVPDVQKKTTTKKK